MASNIIVLSFENEFMAEGMLETVLSLQDDGLIEIEDAVVASRGLSDHIKLKQSRSEAGKFAVRGGGVGLLAGILLGGPIGGLVAGSAIGAIAGKMKDSGLDDDSIAAITEGLAPETSALFLLVKEVEPENLPKVDDTLRKFKANVVKTSLTEENEAQLREVFAKEEYGKLAGE